MTRPKASKPSHVPRAPAGAQTVNQKRLKAIQAKVRIDAFVARLRAEGLPSPVGEVRFAKDVGRDFRWDLAWVGRWLALEIQGGIWKRGKSGHSSGTGIRRDMDKFSLGAALGWRVLLVEPAQLATPETLDLVRQALAWTTVPAQPPSGQPVRPPLRVASRSTARAPDRSTAPDTTTP